MINNSDVFYLSSPKIKLYTASNYIYSDKFDLSINDEKFVSKITTKSDSKSQKFILTSNGIFDTEKLKDYFDLKELVDGKTKIKALFTYDYHQKVASSFITSNLEGVTLKIIEPFNKNKNENVNFILKYQHYPKIKYPTIVTLAEHEFKFRQDDNNLFSEIKSPIARGYLKYPIKMSSESIITGSFEFIDTNFLRSNGVSNLLPKLDIKSKHVKTSKAVLDDVHLILSPTDSYIMIEKLSFNNLHLQMNSSGKWHRGDNEKTEIKANIRSDNLGRALTALDYPKFTQRRKARG